MATNAIRLRRALSLSSSFLTSHIQLSATAATSNSLSSLHLNLISSLSQIPATSPASHRFFHSTHLSLSSSRSFNGVDKIDPGTILFEGCDYKHWLIVMDFGKDPQQRPPPEQMVETYVNTLAKVVGSVEEAKKKMYACSTTTYTGFQAEIDEETSKKFEGMPGVIFVLPDSYIDPVNKEYGGDKYINGTIIPRRPPVQYGRVKRGRHNDFPPNYGPTGMPNRTNYSEEGRHGYQGGRNTSVPPHQGNYNHGYAHQHQMENLPGDRGSYASHGQINNRLGEHSYNHPQEQMRNFPGNHDGYAPQGQMEYPNDSRNYGPPPPARGSDRQTGAGSFEQSAGHYGARAGYGPGGTSPVDQKFSQVPNEQNSMSTEHGSDSPAGQTGMNQRRY